MANRRLHRLLSFTRLLTLPLRKGEASARRQSPLSLADDIQRHARVTALADGTGRRGGPACGVAGAAVAEHFPAMANVDDSPR